MSTPNFDFENKLWNRGIRVVAGCDEVGRGCFAGPVVVGIVTFAPGSRIMNKEVGIMVNDSKKMTERQRIAADNWIRKNALAFGIGEVSVHQINKLGIVKATEKAMRMAIKNSQIKIEHLLSDAFYIPRIPGIATRNQTPIIKGDSLSFSIAAASIIAKVYRDNLMQSLSEKTKYKKYKWAENKGYGTQHHREMILRYGITKHHRTQFVATFLSKQTQ